MLARAVSVEVVFEEIGDDGIGWVDVCLSELEATEFVDDIVRIIGLVKKINIRQDGISDVSDKLGGVSRCLEDMMNECGGS